MKMTTVQTIPTSSSQEETSQSQQETEPNPKKRKRKIRPFHRIYAHKNPLSDTYVDQYKSLIIFFE
jgi:hypothetical protein